MTTALVGPSAADEDKGELKQDRNEVENQIGSAESEFNESSEELTAASNALSTAQADLADAKSTLATTRGELATAEAYDATMASKLATAQANLREAKAELDETEGDLSDATDDAEKFVLDTVANGDPGLMAFNGLIRGEDPNQFTERMSANQAVNEAQIAAMDKLEASRILLDLKREEVADARDEVAEQRQAAADNLDLKQQLEADAETQAASVANLVDDAAAAESRAEEAKQADLAQLDDLKTERDRIGNMLAEIAAKEQAEQEAKEQAEQEAKEQAEEEADHNNNGGPSENNGGPSDNSPSPNPSPDPEPDPEPSSALIYPVPDSYITSPYGMRLHPILNYWKLHDGTDFAAACGTPVVASASGTILEAYYDEGYGNRIVMGHGWYNGVSLATSYNHMTSFTVSPGQYVEQGELIGYSGTTGYSTGCHMHFMVMVNGATVDPMNWL